MGAGRLPLYPARREAVGRRAGHTLRKAALALTVAGGALWLVTWAQMNPLAFEVERALEEKVVSGLGYLRTDQEWEEDGARGGATGRGGAEVGAAVVDGGGGGGGGGAGGLPAVAPDVRVEWEGCRKHLKRKEGVKVRKAWVHKNGEEGKYSHMAMISALPRGSRKHKFLAVWQSARLYEGSHNQHFQFALSKDGRKWGAAQRLDGLLSPGGKGIVWSPVLMSQGDAVRLYYSESQTCLQVKVKDDEHLWSFGGVLKYVESEDGLQWSEPRVALEQAEQGNVPKVLANKGITTTKGNLLLPYWNELPPEDYLDCEIKGENGASVLLSSDAGATWRPATTLLQNAGGLKKTSNRKYKKTWLIEGTLAQLNNGTVLQLFRSAQGVMFSSLSEDQGDTWSPARPYTLPNPNSKFSLTKLSNGYLAVAYNHSANRQLRTFLQVAVSRDDGDNWHKLADLQIQKTSVGKWHYPTLMQDPDRPCTLLVVYSVAYAYKREPKKKKGLPPTGIRVAEIEISHFEFSEVNWIPPSRPKKSGA